jgi:acid phosphatase type 7
MKIIYLSLLSILAYSASTPPDQLRLSWTGNQGEVKVVWVSYAMSTQALSYHSLCSPSSPWVNVSVSTKTYKVGSSPSRTEWLSSGLITNLSPSCTYQYKVANNETWSNVSTFSGRTPGSANDGASAKMLVIADWGTGTTGSLVLQYMASDILSNLYDGLIHAGDIAYDLQDANGLNGDLFLNMIQPVASSMAYMVLPGNHERSSNYSQYRNRFYMPTNTANQGTGLFYSFNIGPAHFVTLNTDAYFYMDAKSQQTQLNWLISDLQTANLNRNVRPWVIVLGHRPMYCASTRNLVTSSTYQACLSEADLLKTSFEDVFYQAGVDLYIQGHLHQYERMTPIYHNKTVKSDLDAAHMHVGAKAPVYITNGVGGNFEGLHNKQDPAEWLVDWSIALGYGRLNVMNTTHLYYGQVGVQTNTVIDYVWLVKTKNRY